MAADNQCQPTNPDVRHTDTPWTLRQFEYSVVLYGPGKIQVMSTSWHGSIRASYPLQAESLANAAFVLEACNSHASLTARVEELEVALWPFAELGGGWPDFHGEFVVCSFKDERVTVEDLRKASAALSRSSGGARGS